MFKQGVLKTGVIGVGVMGGEHTRVYNSLKNSQLVGIYDFDKKLAKKIAKKFDCLAFNSVEELLKNVQAVSICTPTTTHFEIAKKALRHKVSVLIEKPITHSIAEAEDLIKLAKENRTTLAVGHIERFNPVVEVIKKKLKNQKVISINITRMGPIPPRIKDVGIILDLGTHDIDLISYLTGSKFEKVNSVVSSKVGKFEDAAILSFQLKNKTIASVITNWYTPFKVRQIEIATMDKFLVGNLMNQQVIEYSNYDGSGSYITKHLPVKYTEPLLEELNSFIQSSMEGKKPRVTGLDGLLAVRIALVCQGKLAEEKQIDKVLKSKDWSHKFN